jgi:hypothetical protein
MKAASNTLFSALIIASLLVIGTPNAMADDLDGDAVRQLVSGNTVEAVHVPRGYPITTYYLPDGTFQQDRDGERESGTWHVDEQGKLCTMRTGWGGDCRVIAQDGDVWKAYSIPKKAWKGRQHKRTFNKILEGNPHNL